VIARTHAAVLVDSGRTPEANMFNRPSHLPRPGVKLAQAPFFGLPGEMADAHNAPGAPRPALDFAALGYNMQSFWEGNGTKCLGLLVLIIYSATLLSVGFVLGYNVPKPDGGGHQGILNVDAGDMQLAKEHPEAAELLVDTEKYQYQCNTELALHKLQVHWAQVNEMEQRVRGTSQRDHNRFNGLNEKLNRLKEDARGFNECINELMPDVMLVFNSDMAAGRMIDKKAVMAKDGEMRKKHEEFSKKGKDAMSDKQYEVALHKALLKGRAFDPFPKLENKVEAGK